MPARGHPHLSLACRTAALLPADCNRGLRPRRAGQDIRDHGRPGASGRPQNRPAHLLRRLPGKADRAACVHSIQCLAGRHFTCTPALPGPQLRHAAHSCVFGAALDAHLRRQGRCIPGAQPVCMGSHAASIVFVPMPAFPSQLAGPPPHLYPGLPSAHAGGAQHGRFGVHGLPAKVPPHRHLLEVLQRPGQGALPHALQ